MLPRAGAIAQALSEARRAAAVRLAEAVEHELRDLRLAGSRFAVRFECRQATGGVPVTLPADALVPGETQAGGAAREAELGAGGVDQVEFYVTLNPGEPLRPLAKVASGGETARLMLALKTILGAADTVPTLVFDEVDVGIGGRSGDVVGAKLAALGEHRQVVITHLPQVAARAGRHLVVAKRVLGERTFTEVRAIDDDERRQELAAMLGGSSDAHLAAAADMLARRPAAEARP
ncbi:MAG: hypothetical protein U0531_11260 [Dehalococcoidia bacterium]